MLKKITAEKLIRVLEVDRAAEAVIAKPTGNAQRDFGQTCGYQGYMQALADVARALDVTPRGKLTSTERWNLAIRMSKSDAS